MGTLDMLVADASLIDGFEFEKDALLIQAASLEELGFAELSKQMLLMDIPNGFLLFRKLLKNGN